MRVSVRALGATAVVALLAVSVFATGGVSFAQLPPGGTFSDDDLNVHEGYIEAIAADGITNGCDGTGTLYCPSNEVTRAQMASFLVRALDLPSSSTDWFSDDNGSVHESNINSIADAGITVGLGDGLYGPGDSVLRGQMATFLARALPDLIDATTDYFSDDTGIVHEGAINQMAENGITLGCDTSGTLYCPAVGVQRDQMASFLGRALGLEEMIPPPTTTTTTTTIATTSTTQATQTFTISILDTLVFSPSSRTISVGDSILFSKTGPGLHNVAFTSGSTASSGPPTTDTFTFKVTFSTPGTYTFVCDVHETIGMTGTITVTG